MVCTKCEKKLSSNITMDVWKTGAKNAIAGSSGRKINENKLLSSKNSNKFAPYENNCRVCKQRVTQKGAHYCQGNFSSFPCSRVNLAEGCAYKNGICSMCGVKILDTTFHRQSSK